MTETETGRGRDAIEIGNTLWKCRTDLCVNRTMRREALFLPPVCFGY